MNSWATRALIVSDSPEKMDFGEPSPDVIARLYNEIKEKKVSFESHSFIPAKHRRDSSDSRAGLEKPRKKESNETTEESRKNSQSTRVERIHGQFESGREQVTSISVGIPSHFGFLQTSQWNRWIRTRRCVDNQSDLCLLISLCWSVFALTPFWSTLHF